MHTQQTATTPRPIYWTSQAESEWMDRRNAALAFNARRKSSQSDVEEFARERGAKCVNRALVLEFFGEAGAGE